MGKEQLQAVLADYQSAELRPQVRAALDLLDKLTLAPDTITDADVAAVRDAGVPAAAIEEAAFVCVLFTTYTRLADTFKFDIPPLEGFEQSATRLLSAGYVFPGPIAWIAAWTRRRLGLTDP